MKRYIKQIGLVLIRSMYNKNFIYYEKDYDNLIIYSALIKRYCYKDCLEFEYKLNLGLD